MSDPHKKNDRGWFLYQRPDSQFVLRFRDRPGKWRDHRIPREYRAERKAERYALAWLEEYRKQLGERPAFIDPPAERAPTVRDLTDPWVELRDKNPKLSPAIRMQNASNMRQHVLRYPEVADIPVGELGSGVLREWLRKVRDHGRLKKITTKHSRTRKEGEKPGRGGKWIRTSEPLAPYTTRNVVNTLTAFFDDAMAEQWIDLPANPMRHPGVRKEIPDGVTLAGRRVIVHLTKPVAEKLMAAPSTPEARRARYLLAFTSGMREGEIAGVRWDDVDLDAGTVAVTKSLASKGPKGWATIGRTKTDASVRTLPLHPLAVRALRAWKALGWAHHVGRHPAATDPVFPNDKGEPHRPVSARLLREDLAAAGQPTKYLDKHLFDFHALRRSFYTWLRNEGVERDTVEMLMGHSGSTVGDRHYGARDLERMRKAVETIKLDLSAGTLIALPMRLAGGDDRARQAECHVAELVAIRDKPATRDPRFLKDLQYARSDSNGRHSASKARRRCGRTLKKQGTACVAVMPVQRMCNSSMQLAG